ncbi:phytoene/squalene synthase family protein [Novosphingobium sp.]|uniref:phytoene/squalene synthase family protein n=1 Tax=Novosphingobium sp. TaxID=1874826 RepID=UPI003428E12D
MSDRAALVAAARDTIAQGSQSFAAASKLFAPATRERAWLLYAWCRAADDMTDGQELGHGASALDDPAAAQARLEALTALALYSGEEVPLPFAALRAVAHETAMPARFIEDHLAGFALDAAGWQPQSGDDLLRYCYHVAGTVGCMMAVVMGVSPQDEDTLDRACDLGLAFQLANIARDVVPDAHAGRCYLPAEWLDAAGLDAGRLADPQALPALAALAARLVEMARPYRRSARVGAARLPGGWRCWPPMRSMALSGKKSWRAAPTPGTNAYGSAAEEKSCCWGKRCCAAFQLLRQLRATGSGPGPVSPDATACAARRFANGAAARGAVPTAAPTESQS